MNRKQLLAALAADGYKGATDLDSIKKYIEANGLTLRYKGADVDVDKAFGTKAMLEVSDPGDEYDSATKAKAAADELATKQASIDAREKALEAEKKTIMAEVAAKRAGGGGLAHIQTVNINRGATVAAKSMYDKKAKAGLTLFADADTSEVFGAYMRQAIFKANKLDTDYRHRDADIEILQKAGLTTTNTAVGVLIPDEFRPQLIYLTEQYGVAKKVANISSMSRDVQQFPRKTAIMSMTHVGQNTTTTAADPALDMVQLVAQKVMGTSVVSNEALEDAAVSVGDLYAQSWAEAYGITVDQDYWLGDGTSTYGGFNGVKTALPAGAYVNASGNAWSAVVAADLDKCPGLVQNVDVKRCAFVSSRQFYYQRVASLDTATSQFKALAGGPIGGSDASYKGWPWFFSQVFPTASASTSKFLAFGDFMAGSMIGERRDFSIASSEHAAFTSDAMTYRATARFAVNIHGDGRGSTYGPIVMLVTT